MHCARLAENGTFKNDEEWREDLVRLRPPIQNFPESCLLPRAPKHDPIRSQKRRSLGFLSPCRAHLKERGFEQRCCTVNRPPQLLLRE